MSLPLLKEKRTFVLDKKVLLPRMTRSGHHLRAETKYWDALKQSVRTVQEIDWQKLTHSFRLMEMVGPEKLEHANRIDHLRLKGLYSFFQMGYVVMRDDRVALFHRHSSAHKISLNFSPILSCATSGLSDHASAIDKIRMQLGRKAQVLRVTPYAIGYTELKAVGETPSPAYFWLIHKVDVKEDLPTTCQPMLGCDSFVGMKKPDSLLNGKVLVHKQQVTIDRDFDRLVLELLANQGAAQVCENAAIRPLTPREFNLLPATPFRTGTEHLARRLTLLRLLTVLGVSSIATTTYAVDLLQRGEWVCLHSGDILTLLDGIKETIENCF